MNAYLLHGVRWAALGLVMVIANTIGGMLAHALLADTVSTAFLNTPIDWPALLMIAAAEAAAAYWLLTSLQVDRRHQVWILFVFYWGTKYFQMLIEAAFYLNIWQLPPVMSWPELAFSSLYGTVTSVLFCAAAVFIVNAGTAETRGPVVLPRLMPVLVVGAVYVPIYFIAGMFIAVPLSGPAFAGTYENMQLPAWLPLFQFARGIVWAGILWFLVGNHRPGRDARITAAITLCIFSSVSLIQPNPYMQDALRFAHLVELMVSMAVLGWISAWIFNRGHGSVPAHA